MGKLIEPKKRWIEVIDDEVDWNGLSVQQIGIVVDYWHAEKVQAVFDAADCVADIGDQDDQGLCCVMYATIDPRCDYDTAKKYIIQAVLRKISPRNWRTILMDEFNFGPDY